MSLARPTDFFDSVKKSLFKNALVQPQVDGVNALLKAAGERRWPIAWTAYMLATAFHETNATMQPVVEAYFLGEPKATNYRKTLRYYPAYGRGYVQITWADNYAKADKELGLGGALIKNYDLALRPGIAAKIAVHGCEFGWFTGKSMQSYLPAPQLGTTAQFTQARRIINGTDRAADIAGYALLFQAALVAGAWS